MKEKEVKTYSGKIIYDALQQSSMDVETLAKRLGTTSAAIYHWFDGRRIISFNNIESVINALHIDEQKLTDAIKKDKLNAYDIKIKSKPKQIHLSANAVIQSEMTCNMTLLVQIPILGEVPAGPLQEAMPKMRSEATEWEYLADEGLNAELLFGLHVVGESMIGKGIDNGDVIIVYVGAETHNGDIVVAMVNEEVTVKTLLKDKNNGIIILQSANDKIQPIILHENDYDHVRIIGKVIRVIKKL